MNKLSIHCVDTGRSVKRWVENFLAFPYYGEHYFWRREAVELAEDIANMIDHFGYTEIHFRGHSRGGAVALYAISRLIRHYPDVKITAQLTGVPKVWYGKIGHIKMRAVNRLALVENYKARGDIVTWVPMWFKGHTATVIGEGWWPSWRKHKPGYYRIYM